MTRDSSGDWSDAGETEGTEWSRRTWPWVVAPAILVGVVAALAVAWMFVFSTTTGCACSKSISPPVVGLEYDHDNATVEVTHERGRKLTEEDTEKLDIRIDGEERAVVPLPFAEGDSTEVEGVQPGDVVQVVLTPSGENANAMVIGSYEVPDRES